MPNEELVVPSRGAWLSVDVWAVLIALLLALAVRLGWIHSIPW